MDKQEFELADGAKLTVKRNENGLWFWSLRYDNRTIAAGDNCADTNATMEQALEEVEKYKKARP